MAGFRNDTMYADNVDFTGAVVASPQVTADGQLLIGSTVAPNIRVATLVAGTNIVITNGAGSIQIDALPSLTIPITKVDFAMSPYTVLTTDQYLSVDATGGIVTLVLEDTPPSGRVLRIKDANGMSATNNIRMAPLTVTTTIDFQPSYTILWDYASLSLIYDDFNNNYEVF